MITPFISSPYKTDWTRVDASSRVCSSSPAPYLHPLPTITNPLAKKKQYVRLNLLIQDALLTRFNFIISDIVNPRAHTHVGLVSMRRLVLSVKSRHSSWSYISHTSWEIVLLCLFWAVGRSLADKKRGWGGRRFFTACGDVFVRIVEDGVLWIESLGRTGDGKEGISISGV